MAGEGSRFVKAGYKKPKPFIDILGKPMIVRVLENLYLEKARYILIVRKDHMDKEKDTIEKILKNFNAVFIPIDKLTEGTACTVLYAQDYINNSYPLLIANSDQLVDCKINDFISDCYIRELDGSILTFFDEEKDSKWSFAKVNDLGFVEEVKEKKAISNYATVGIYFFSQGREYIKAAIDMIIRNDRVNNEFYTCPVYNYLIKYGANIGIFNIKPSDMHGVGTPSDLNEYIRMMKDNV